MVGLITADNPSQRLDIKSDSSLRLADHADLSKDGLVLPVLQTQPETSGRNVIAGDGLDTLSLVASCGESEDRVCRGRSRASADDGGDVARVLQGLAELQVEVAVGDGGKTQAGLGGIVQVGAHCGKVDERHFG